jgi:hypothetical protein
MKVTASNIIQAIAKLPRNVPYDYPNSKNAGKILIKRVDAPEGPIVIARYNPNKGQGLDDAKESSISTQMIWRIADSIQSNKPLNFDRILGASYNTRSAFEALLLHTPEYYSCYPGRIERVSGNSTKVQSGHKHVLWLPNEPHTQGIIVEKKTDMVISEITSEGVYDSLQVTPVYEMDIEISRRHAQIQVALILIGQQLGFRTWVANNDKGIIYKQKRLGQMESVIQKLGDEKLLTAYTEAVQAALLIDCIWFRNSRFMPAVMEIEHSTGVTSGLTRMKHFYDNIPLFSGVRWTIVAPDEDRAKVMKEASKEQFRQMDIKFFPYSAVEELYSLCERRKLKGINDDFLDCFMEDCIAS